jgi:hypothetical protein
LNAEAQSEWKYALSLITAAFFALGASGLFGALLPGHPFTGKWIALGVTFAWVFCVRQLDLLPSRWVTAKRNSFSFLSALISSSAFFVFMLAVLSFANAKLSLFEFALAAAGGVLLGIYSGMFRRAPSPVPHSEK